MNGSTAVMAGFGAIWVTNTSTGSVQRVNPLTNKVVSVIAVGNQPRFLAAGDGGVWVRGAVRAGGGQVWVSAHDTSKIWALNPSLK